MPVIEPPSSLSSSAISANMVWTATSAAATTSPAAGCVNTRSAAKPLRWCSTIASADAEREQRPDEVELLLDTERPGLAEEGHLVELADEGDDHAGWPSRGDVWDVRARSVPDRGEVRARRGRAGVGRRSA
ncbi:hypothetical protein [Amycolatopsis sp. NBRC 101858]|uniref:hypothetical protein n=1 Tax=Amycolatopsis sp. NBRC 101858 TaxID=3032200 RepID=UPI002552BBC3|nr:hypothetical protein [Amycolatopsis sp. NBRC 101858]